MVNAAHSVRRSRAFLLGAKSLLGLLVLFRVAEGGLGIPHARYPSRVVEGKEGLSRVGFGGDLPLRQVHLRAATQERCQQTLASFWRLLAASALHLCGPTRMTIT